MEVPVKSRVSATYPTFMSAVEVQYQRHRPHPILLVTCNLHVPTRLTPVFNNLLCFDSVRVVKKVSQLVNLPVVCLFDTRVSGTRT